MNRAERRHRRVPNRPSRLNPDADYAVMAAWAADEDALDDARKQTHDLLIAMMGESRSGPVRWKWSSGSDAVEMLEHLKSGPVEDELADYYRRLGGHLREYGGYLVVAMAEGQP